MAQSCNINSSAISNSIKDTVSRQMEFSGKFTKDGEFFTINNDAIDSQSVVDKINLSFGEELVTRMGLQPLYGILDPSDQLVNKYLSKAGKKDVAFDLKSVEILSSDKGAKTFEKGIKNRWPLDKILSELQIPSQQKDVILSLGTDDREEIVTELVSKFTYTVEINTAKQESSIKNIAVDDIVRQNQDSTWEVYNPTIGVVIEGGFKTKKEAEEFSGINEKPYATFNSSYYSTLTVPGGTNYTENEIKTPDITPSITGHAQFATKQGIGWFRSDDKLSEQGLTEEQEKVKRQLEIKNRLRAMEGLPPLQSLSKQITSNEGNATKTRRILEVQSDLFQKGRGNEQLVKKESYIGRKYFHQSRDEEFTIVSYDEGSAPSFSSDENQMEPGDPRTMVVQFEDGSEVTFYENEINDFFSSGLIRNPIQIRKQESKNDFLQLLNKENNWVTFFVKSIIQDSAKKGYEKVLFPVGDTAAKVEGHETVQGFIDNKQAQLDKIKSQIEKFPNLKSEKWDNEIKQIEKEIEDAKAGKLKISSIANFYETTVQNVLKKQGYSPTRITDEYGNDWYEVTTKLSDLNNIYLSAKTLGNDLSDQQDSEFSRLQKLGLISQESNVVGGKQYFKIPGQKDPDRYNRLSGIITSRKLDFINIIDSPDSYLIQLGNVEKVPQEVDKTTSSKASSITKARVLRFLENIGFRDIQMVSQLVYKGQKIKGSSYIDFLNGVMQIVEGTENYVLPEEAMHILTTLIKQSRPELFNRMKKEIVNYQVYRSVVNDEDYTKNPLYRDEEGNLNYDKLKEEAVAKLLAERLINDLEGTVESARRQETIRDWWQQILQWIREKFGSYKNPFKEALDQLNEDDRSFGEWADISNDDIFLSAKTLETIDNENPDTKAMWETIRSRPEAENIYKVDNEYFKGDVKISSTQRVSDLVDRYYAKLFGNRNFDESLKEFYEQSRKDGSYLHEIMEEIINSWVDPATGLINKNPSSINFPLEGNPIQGKIVEDARKFVRQFMSSFPEGTRFLTEQVIHDPNAVNADKSKGRFGTIDFLAIVPTDQGPRVDIIDWKSMLLEDLEGAKDYKRGAIFTQLSEYSRILKDVYGVERFGKIRAIPIKKHYKTDKTTKERKLQGIDMKANATQIPSSERYLRPIIAPQESTGSEVKDILVKKLEALYQKYIDRGYFQENRSILNDVQEAIYEIRVSSTVSNLTNYFTDLTTKFRQSLPEFEKLQDGKKEDITEALALLSFYQDIIENVVKPSFNLIEDTTINVDARGKLQTVASQLLILNDKMNTSRNNLLDSLAKKQGIFDLLLPEKVVGLFKRYLRSMGSQDIASVKYAYELVRKAYNRITISTDNDLKTLKDLKFNFEQWRKDKGISAKDAIAKLVDFSKGKIHSKISEEFYNQRKEVIESKDAKKILEFIKTNYNLAEYTEWYNKSLAENKKLWESSTYDTDPKKNNLIIKNKLETFAKNYNITSFPITAFGYHNPKVWSRNIKEELWLSDSYKEIEKEKPLLDMYNFMVNKNKQLADVGGIKDLQQYTFFPNVKKTFADVVSFEDSSTLEKVKDLTVNSYRNFVSSLTVEDYELNYQGARDPFTGAKLEKRFIPYINKLDNDEQSFDVFAVYALMSKQVNKETYLQENDEILRSLVHLERMKPNLLENRYNKLSIDSQGRAEVSKEIGKNAAVLEEHVKAIVNGENLQVDADFTIQLRLRELWNRTPMAKLYGGKFAFDISPETYKPRAISATKFVMWLNNANQRRVLGLNAASALSNVLGGSYASNRLYKKYVGENDINKAWFKITSGSFYQSEGMKKNAALVDYFLPLLNNRESFKASQLSVNNAATILSQEWLMAPMRKGSEIVQLNIFLAVMENTGVIDGKIVNLREKAALELDYYNRHDKPLAEQKAIEKKLEERIEEYKKKYGLEKVAKFKTIKEAGKDKVIIDIPGVDRNSPDVENLRDLVQTMSKDALGETDEYDLANYKYNIWWRLFMTFKNWIPRQLDVRFGEFRYDQAHHSHEYGRFRMFAKALSANFVQTAMNFIPIPYVTGKLSKAVFSDEAMIERAKKVYQQKIQEAKVIGKYNKDTFISQGEFVDQFLKGVDSTFAEMRTIILMMSLLFIGLAAPDDDDDSQTKAYKALIRKQVDKLSDEVGFFYSPKSFIDIAGGGPPIVSLVRDTWNLGSDVLKQFFGFSFEQLGWDEKGIKMQEQAKPIKRSFKVFPVLKEILTYLPAMDEELAKEWGVRINDRRGF